MDVDQVATILATDAGELGVVHTFMGSQNLLFTDHAGQRGQLSTSSLPTGAPGDVLRLGLAGRELHLHEAHVVALVNYLERWLETRRFDEGE